MSNIIARLISLMLDQVVSKAGLADTSPEPGETESGIGLRLVGWQFGKAQKIVPPDAWNHIREVPVKDGVVLRVPGVQSQGTGSSEDIFDPIPGTKADTGYLTIGEYDPATDSYPWEGYVTLHLGPDGNIWAKVGDHLENLPEVTE